ncbi:MULTISPECIES: hypothetical protein [unclassified Fusibacter]|uniref:hypothetical protein n=1 Tax=unclassified Fusibacter TaxID=2624464 RepID=UPI0010110039|nr:MULTISPECIES: hypothetical protein [unclassified Fusibacter]MCK8060313.1 hypothetical protein [Fusibacter sp. A2]NPE20398.1 hypothetical protein [Fusibacter sp. A1]RXV63602.1 hypothetical protein DWB64_01100 [Fusibacter sp. A1]
MHLGKNDKIIEDYVLTDKQLEAIDEKIADFIQLNSEEKLTEKELKKILKELKHTHVVTNEFVTSSEPQITSIIPDFDRISCNFFTLEDTSQRFGVYTVFKNEDIFDTHDMYSIDLIGRRQAYPGSHLTYVIYYKHEVQYLIRPQGLSTWKSYMPANGMGIHFEAILTVTDDGAGGGKAWDYYSSYY